MQRNVDIKPLEIRFQTPSSPVGPSSITKLATAAIAARVNHSYQLNNGALQETRSLDRFFSNSESHVVCLLSCDATEGPEYSIAVKRGYGFILRAERPELPFLSAVGASAAVNETQGRSESQC